MNSQIALLALAKLCAKWALWTVVGLNVILGIGLLISAFVYNEDEA